MASGARDWCTRRQAQDRSKKKGVLEPSGTGDLAPSHCHSSSWCWPSALQAILKDAALNAAVVFCSRLAFESSELLHRLALQSSRVGVIGARAILKDAALNGFGSCC